MTCQEVQHCFESYAAWDETRFDREWIAEHIAECAACSSFVDTRKDLESSLRLVRDAAPRVPASLDASILAGYRRRIAELQEPEESVSRWSLMVPSLRLAAVAALAVAVALFFMRKFSLTTSEQPLQQRSAAASSPKKAPRGPNRIPRRESHKYTVATETISHRDAIVTRSTKQSRPSMSPEPAKLTSSPTLVDDSSHEAFQSLMYCDELSCGDGMELVRVQLPSPALPFVPGATSMKRVVSADVLVGADGIARGFRIVH